MYLNLKHRDISLVIGSRLLKHQNVENISITKLQLKKKLNKNVNKSMVKSHIKNFYFDNSSYETNFLSSSKSATSLFSTLNGISSVTNHNFL